ncbi:hypothetical protein [Halobacillus sp. BBL2006]|uniref:hypothetical protein n=1 Tax=Halobacillus sp. BBL2006 TaxID=1543706 RepID=UPI0005440203|nr:hypothetical protein [Halobacillus sp. BBL2006]KHE67080.1 hypothetical protein LD39_19390 [Halobacillus sp. BBL2006]
MAKHVEAFFQTENDAESAKASLQKLTIEHEMVEAIPEDKDLTTIVPVGGSSSTGGGAFNFTEVVQPAFDDEGALFDKRHLTHILHFEVQEEEYERALEIIKEHEGHMDKSHL